MKKILKNLKTFFLSSKMKTFYWQTANGFIVILIGTLTTLKPDVVDPKMVIAIAGVLSALNWATKTINKTYLTRKK